MSLALALALLVAAAPPPAPWEPAELTDGVQVFRRDIPGSDIVAFRGETLIDAPLERVLWVILDGPRRPEWVDRLVEDRTLEMPNPFERVVYQRYGMPPLISDRDTVFRAEVRRAGPTRIQIDLRPTLHPKGPPTVGVRSNSEGTYHLEARGAGTWIAVDVFADPGGWIPIWLVNLIQESWPVETLSAIRRQVKKSHVQDHPLPP